MSTRKDHRVEDRTLSPYTGWTRGHWERTADALLAAVRPYASSRHALIDLPGAASASGRWSDGLEGFARTFLLAGFRLAGNPDDPSGLAEWYAEGLRAGTDPASPQRWPRFDEIAQAKVEAASIAIALHETRPLIWDRLDDRVRQQIVDWFARMVGNPLQRNNWAWFQGVTNAFLRSVGAPWSVDDVEAVFALNEEFYVGDGWYSDGNRRAGEYRNFDHYCGWAMQFYPAWFCRIAATDDYADQLRTYRERLHRYLQDAVLLVGADGAPLFQGRSLTYRFAACAPFWTGAVFDATPLSPGLTRRIASGMVRHFLDAGCVDEAGLLTVGWHRPFLPIRQAYSGPASPYWASKGFAGLVLPATHPVWTAIEEPMPIEQHDVERTLAAPGWVVSGTRADGIVRIANHGSDHSDPLDLVVDDSVYARHSYSTRTGPALGEWAGTAPDDSHVALIGPDGAPSMRRPLRRITVAGRVGTSRHVAHWLVGPAPDRSAPLSGAYRTGPVITSASVLRGAHEVRLARVDPGGCAEPWPAATGPFRVRISGHPVAGDRRPAERCDAGLAEVRDEHGLRSIVLALRGTFSADVVPGDGTNAFGPCSSVPVLTGPQPVRPGEVIAVVVTLTADTAVTADGIAVEVHEDAAGTQVTVRWADGDVERLRLDPPVDDGVRPSSSDAAT